MAVSPIEEKILGRLASDTAPSLREIDRVYFSDGLYRVLGLSILLSRKLAKARKIRKLDRNRDTSSLQLYHQIIWMAREGLTTTEDHILPQCPDGKDRNESLVMAAKLRASFNHILCLFHNHPPLSHLSAQSDGSGSSPSSVLTPIANNIQTRSPSRKSPRGKDRINGSRAQRVAALRDPIPSMTSDTSYVTNPYAAGDTRTPPPNFPPPPIPNETRSTPMHPPGLTPTDLSPTQASATFLLPAWNFIPIAKDYFEYAQRLANNLLSPANALRLSVSLEHATFLWECSKEYDRSRRLARRTIKEVYASAEGLTDNEFADAAELVQSLGGIVRREPPSSALSSGIEPTVSPNQAVSRAPPIDRTIAVSPANKRSKTDLPNQLRSILRTPERLSTVPEVESFEAEDATSRSAISPPVSRLSSRSRRRQTPSVTSDKASKRRAVEQAEERVRLSGASNASGGSHSRQSTPQGYVSQSTGRSSRKGGNG